MIRISIFILLVLFPVVTKLVQEKFSMQIVRSFNLLEINRFVLLSAIMILLFLQTNAQERLIIVGGGKRPEAAMAKFVEWAGKERAHILDYSVGDIGTGSEFRVFKKGFGGF
ncbi:MAG: hypothetical protein WKF71_15750 [Pyrinomonadaceae bacterium]